MVIRKLTKLRLSVNKKVAYGKQLLTFYAAFRLLGKLIAKLYSLKPYLAATLFRKKIAACRLDRREFLI
jgi:hypothetical protein